MRKEFLYEDDNYVLSKVSETVSVDENGMYNPSYIDTVGSIDEIKYKNTIHLIYVIKEVKGSNQKDEKCNKTIELCDFIVGTPMFNLLHFQYLEAHKTEDYFGDGSIVRICTDITGIKNSGVTEKDFLKYCKSLYRGDGIFFAFDLIKGQL